MYYRWREDLWIYFGMILIIKHSYKTKGKRKRKKEKKKKGQDGKRSTGAKPSWLMLIIMYALI